jgi:hypothetical protein
MVIGFTGTRVGMTAKQKRRVKKLLEKATEAHHGDCVGADEQFHELCIAANVPVIIHPPSDPKLRAWCKGAKKVCRPKPYLERNKDIVISCDVLVGAPKESSEPAPGRGQGTWSTIRYGRAVGNVVKTIYP